MKKERKLQYGITLIALVITIIVILIIAGTAVSITVNSEGLMSKTDKATKKSNLKSLKESVDIAYLLSKTDDTEGTFKEKIEEQMEGIAITEVAGHTDVVCVEKDGVAVTAYENGDILEGKTEFWGEKLIECPKFEKKNDIWNWQIFTPGQLNFLSIFVNNGNSLTGETNLTSYVVDYETEDVTMNPETTIYLMNNLDLGARPGEGATESAKWALNTKWTPIGIDETNVINKLGTFEGNNYCIKGVYVNRDGDYNGIFGNSNTIRNLTIKDSYIEGAEYTGGIVGYGHGGEIKNCHNNNTIVNGKSCIGGIAGLTNQLIYKCSNSGNITCKNTNNAMMVGGISGALVGGENNVLTIDECVNSGTVEGRGTYTGGILGQTRYSIITNCVNSGQVIHRTSTSGYQQDIGGVTGFIIGSRIEKCANTGTIQVAGSFTGGIVGRVLSTNAIVNCYNTGFINGKNGSGGIMGAAYGNGNPSSIENCYNIGAINGTSNIGGLIGEMGNQPTCTNSYYLTGTATRDIGNASASNFVKDKNYITTTFVSTANQNEIAWEVIENKNDGFPVLVQN